MGKKILFANLRTPPPFFLGGDSLSTHELFCYLHSKDYACYWLGTFEESVNTYSCDELEKELNRKGIQSTISPLWLERQFDQSNESLYYQYPYSIQVIHQFRFLHYLERVIRSFKPDYLVTQVDGAELALQVGASFGIPLRLIVHDAGDQNLDKIRLINSYANGKVVTVSKFLEKKYTSIFQIPHQVIYPPCNLDIYTAPLNKTPLFKPQYITMINPIRDKGGDIFYKVAEAMPTVSFMSVYGWYDPIFDNIHLATLPNIKLLPKQTDMYPVYAASKVLLLPSLCEESFSRVALEACACGVMVIASQIGGIPEILNDSGILLKDYRSVSAWIDAIKYCLELPSHNRMRLKAIKNSKRFRYPTICDQYIRFFFS